MEVSKDQIAEWFDMFWAIYWLKVARKAAFRAWQKNVRSEETFAQIMDAVRLQHFHMMKRQPEFRPHAATWLNGMRWNDVLSPSGGYKPFQASVAQRDLNKETGEYVTLPAVPTVAGGPNADEWRKKNAR